MAVAPKTVLITGCSSGIGLALAVKLAQDKKQRFKVIATMRDVGKRGALEAAAGPALGRTLDVKQLDVGDERSIRACVDSLPGRRVDVLGERPALPRAAPAPPPLTSPCPRCSEQRRRGHDRPPRVPEPARHAAPHGHQLLRPRIVFNDIYAASKFAVEGFCESLVVQTLHFNIAISLVEPGPVTTEFETKVYEEAERADYSRTDPETADIFMRLYLRNSRDVFASLGQSAEDVAEVLEPPGAPGLAGRPPFRHRTNAACAPLAALRHADPSGALATAALAALLFRRQGLLRLGLRALRLLRWKAQKLRQGARLLGLR
uniref:Retinol dehydrogenase 8 n=1 Tax=Nothoprocta perdicaria TaxID=30464 RepID=A0A8C6ZJ63_NOTPE